MWTTVSAWCWDAVRKAIVALSLSEQIVQPTTSTITIILWCDSLSLFLSLDLSLPPTHLPLLCSFQFILCLYRDVFISLTHSLSPLLLSLRPEHCFTETHTHTCIALLRSWCRIRTNKEDNDCGRMCAAMYQREDLHYNLLICIYSKMCPFVTLSVGGVDATHFDIDCRFHIRAPWMMVHSMMVRTTCNVCVCIEFFTSQNTH